MYIHLRRFLCVCFFISFFLGGYIGNGLYFPLFKRKSLPSIDNKKISTLLFRPYICNSTRIPAIFHYSCAIIFFSFFIIIIIIMFVSEIFLCEFLSNGHLIYQESPANRKKITKKLKDIRLHNRITMCITLRTSPPCFITQVSIFPFSIMKNMFLINYKHCIFSSFTTSK